MQDPMIRGRAGRDQKLVDWLQGGGRGEDCPFGPHTMTWIGNLISIETHGAVIAACFQDADKELQPAVIPATEAALLRREAEILEAEACDLRRRATQVALEARRPWPLAGGDVDAANLEFILDGYGFGDVELTETSDGWTFAFRRLLVHHGVVAMAVACGYTSTPEEQWLEELGLPEVSVDHDSDGATCHVTVEGPTRADVVGRGIQIAWAAADPSYYVSPGGAA